MKKSELQKLVAESVTKVLKENFDPNRFMAQNKLNSNNSDIQELKKIYNKTYELDQFVASTAFENSPIVEHTNAIMQYCIAQKKRIFQSKGLGE